MTERQEWLAQLELDPQACRYDLPDLTRFMLATGVRIGEALALYWEDVDLDLGTVLIDWTVVRYGAKGPDSLGGLRDPSNTRRVLREARGSEDFAWVTSHVFRRTAATILDEAGLPARAIADQLGHSKPSITQDMYLGRGIASPAAAAALELALSEGQSNPGAKPGR